MLGITQLCMSVMAAGARVALFGVLRPFAVTWFAHQQLSDTHSRCSALTTSSQPLAFFSATARVRLFARCAHDLDDHFRQECMMHDLCVDTAAAMMCVSLNPLSGLLGFALGLNHPFRAQRVLNFTT